MKKQTLIGGCTATALVHFSNLWFSKSAYPPISIFTPVKGKMKHQPLPAPRHARGGRGRQCSPCENERVGQLMYWGRSTECNACRFGVTLRWPKPEINLPPASKRRSYIHVRGFSLDERGFIDHPAHGEFAQHGYRQTDS